MSSRINSIVGDTSTNFGNSLIPSLPPSTNNTLAANCDFVKTIILVRNAVINLISYTQSVSGIKTFTNASGILFNSTAVSGILGTTLSIGSTVATTAVNILSSASTGAQLYIFGTLQPLLPAGTAGYSLPLVTNRSTTSKIVCGITSTATAGVGTSFNFPTPFSVGCVPVLVASPLNVNPTLCSFYQPSGVASHIGAGVVCNATGRNVFYIAVGF